MRRISVSAVAGSARLVAGEVKIFAVECHGNPWIYLMEKQFPRPPARTHLASWPDEPLLISEEDRARMLLALVPTGPVRIIPSQPGSGLKAMMMPPR